MNRFNALRDIYIIHVKNNFFLDKSVNLIVEDKNIPGLFYWRRLAESSTVTS